MLDPLQTTTALRQTSPECTATDANRRKDTDTRNYNFSSSLSGHENSLAQHGFTAPTIRHQSHQLHNDNPVPQIVNSNGKIRGLLRCGGKLAKVDELPQAESRPTSPKDQFPTLHTHHTAHNTPPKKNTNPLHKSTYENHTHPAGKLIPNPAKRAPFLKKPSPHATVFQEI
jgi:hypothetical protein